MLFRSYEGWSALIVPATFALASMGLLVYGGFRSLPPVALACATAALLTAFLRAGLTFRETRVLAEARREAVTDELTGLPNRRWFYRELATALDGEGESDPAALLLIDLDGFKELNDTLGHQLGDIVLEMVGTRLTNTVKDLGTLARLGGDEFAVLLGEAGTAEECARRVHDELSAGFTVEGLTASIGASVGIALYPADAADANALLRRADIAMYEAKRKRIPYAFYSPSDDHFSLDRLALTGELRGAMARGELALVYQPKIEIPSGEVSAVEALLRWHHPDRGEIRPDDFIPLAEQSGLMRELTHWVLRQALHQCGSWRSRGLDLPVSVNVSASDLIDAEFPVVVHDLLEGERLPTRFLQLEITEGVLMADPEHARGVVEQLSRLGVRIALDDFGTGYSSLEYLSSLRFDELKIDKSFVIGMKEARNAAIIKYAAQLGRGLGLDVVAEGVEDGSFLEPLARCGCSGVQGFHFTPPLPPGQLEAWVRAHAPLTMHTVLRVAAL